jgi:NAD+ synthase (glutamine-hydrolysing)
MRALGIAGEEIDIRPAAMQMLKDMKHPFAEGKPVYDIAFENVQAGLRTDYLFRLANQRRGFVIGTGNLSEVALGWSTYGVGDQMSHYGVNAGVPKTLIQYLIRWAVKTGQFDSDTNAILEAILATKISPELIPADDKGEMQSTEGTIGPYELHDFFLFHILRSGQPPSKVAFLAWQAWRDSDEGQAHRHPQFAQGLGRRGAQPPRRLARAERRDGEAVARRAEGGPGRIGSAFHLSRFSRERRGPPRSGGR